MLRFSTRQLVDDFGWKKYIQAEKDRLMHEKSRPGMKFILVPSYHLGSYDKETGEKSNGMITIISEETFDRGHDDVGTIIHENLNLKKIQQ